MNKTNSDLQILDTIQNSIYTIRGMQVMLDEDLAKLYQVETKTLNRAVKRNIERFPTEFRFQLTNEELEILRFQFGTLSDSHNSNLKYQDGTSSEISLRFQNGTLEKGRGKHKKYLPYAFTEQGVVMLSAVLRSNVAIKVSIQISNAFVEMRRFITNNVAMFSRLESVEQKQITTDKKVDELFNSFEAGAVKPRQGIFYDGQVFDAYVFVSKLIKSAKKSIVLIDNFVDESVLELLSKSKKGIIKTIYTKNIPKVLKQDIKKYNIQHIDNQINVKAFAKAHDRFLIIDSDAVYHFGASLKDLGKKWFAFSKFDKEAIKILSKLNN